MFFRTLLVPLLTFFVLAPCAAQTAANNLPVPARPIIGAKSYVLIDANSGATLVELEADAQLAPASLTKLMTAYAVFKSLKANQISLDDEVTISEKAWRMSGSRMFIEVGNKVSVRDLLLGVIVQSGNDASVALAEYVAGTESVFAELMNQYANALGMHTSHFMNATGLPDPDHYSTARDMAILARAIVTEFPDYYHWYSIKEYKYNNITQSNRNSLLWRDPSVDGMKTGHTEDAGYCLVSSALRDDMRLISVVLGTASAKARTDGSQALLNYGFRFFETRLLYAAGEEVTNTKVWQAEHEFSALGISDDMYITFPRGSYDSLKPVLELPATIKAPIAAGQPVGELKIDLNGETLITTSLRALDNNPDGSMWQQARDAFWLLFE
jgi:D-alanyl-D-alanine carboxypeptidase (penicillin-binding protein 5/6)